MTGAGIAHRGGSEAFNPAGKVVIMEIKKNLAVHRPSNSTINLDKEMATFDEDALRDFLDRVLETACREQASDVYFKAGNPPYLRILGQMHPIECGVLPPELTEALTLRI